MSAVERQGLKFAKASTQVYTLREKSYHEGQALLTLSSDQSGAEQDQTQHEDGKRPTKTRSSTRRSTRGSSSSDQ